MTDRETIFALSSGQPPCAVAIIRISGPATQDILAGFGCAYLEPRMASLRVLSDPISGEPLDQGLVVWMPGPASFTGEDTAELQIHGGRAVVQVVLSALSQMDSARSAEPGEFTRRAFENGRMDLAEVEGLADLIAADTDRQREQALRQMGGGLSAACQEWRSELIRLRALIEAEFDFSEEEDVPDELGSEVWRALETLSGTISNFIGDNRRGEIIRDGFRVALLGPPNAGKSSLLNFLVKRDAAIVTEHAGTTRDVIEVQLDIDGYRVTVSDTAGLRRAENPIEMEGIRRAYESGRDSDLVLWLEEAGDVDGWEELPEELDRQKIWRVLTKADLGSRRDNQSGLSADYFLISVVTGQGTDQLLEALKREISGQMSHSSEVMITRHRHRENLEAANSCLIGALTDPAKPLELLADDLRRASDAIGRVVGAVDVEDLLDYLFAEFCIGK